jgi:FtsP/CotA-like multicopper oxidase with cupredoxin domain
MSNADSRRKFLVNGAAVAGAGLIAGTLAAQEQATKDGTQQQGTHAGHGAMKGHEQMQMPMTDGQSNDIYPRMEPGVGGPVGSPTDRGKLVPGLRDPKLGPVPIHAPDLQTLDWKMVNGAKEFHLTAEPVRRELLPGLWMDTYGYNGGMPGPSIEINQGDRVRIIVRNKLPEATSMHWHGLEVPVAMDGVPHLVQTLIEPGKTFTYEFTVHQEGTFFYHSHVGMQETMGMVGLFIVHPKTPHQPVIDKDFCLIAQEFQLRPNSTVPDTLAMEWNYLSFNGRCGPYTTPMVCRLGERVRIRFVNFSVIDHHPLHLHGHTFWVTGNEGGRIPEPAWVPSNNVLVGVAQAREIEFIANNPGDWILHCHMFHHMMNSMTSQAGPIVREFSKPEQMRVPGYPQNMLGMTMASMGKMESMKMDGMKPNNMKLDGMSGTGQQSPYAMDMQGMGMIEGRREAAGMRSGWSMGVEGLSTVVRVLPPGLYDKLVNTNDPIPPNTSTPWGPGDAMPMNHMQHEGMKMDGMKMNKQ